MINPHTVVTAMQLPGVLMTITSALDGADGDPGRAAQNTDAIRAWDEAEPEVRSCLLLSSAWGAGRGQAPAVPDGMHDQVGPYVEDFHQYAAGFPDDQAEAFHGDTFPAMPLRGQAGALASSLGFDRDDLQISLGVVLVLLAAGRKAGQADPALNPQP